MIDVEAIAVSASLNAVVETDTVPVLLYVVPPLAVIEPPLGLPRSTLTIAL